MGGRREPGQFTSQTTSSHESDEREALEQPVQNLEKEEKGPGGQTTNPKGL
jgi:hypothetical protein